MKSVKQIVKHGVNGKLKPVMVASVGPNGEEVVKPLTFTREDPESWEELRKFDLDYVLKCFAKGHDLTCRAKLKKELTTRSRDRVREQRSRTNAWLIAHHLEWWQQFVAPAWCDDPKLAHQQLDAVYGRCFKDIASDRPHEGELI